MTMSPIEAILLRPDFEGSDEELPFCIMVWMDRRGRFFPAGAADPSGVVVRSADIAMGLYTTELRSHFELLDKMVLWLFGMARGR